nr:SJCHGC08298 protein [Schistosoma japonicum]
MIFPPFPPSYNESQRKSCLVSNVGRVQRNHCMAFQSNQSRRYRRRLAGVSRPRFHLSARSRFSRLLCRYTSHRSNLLHTTSASRHPRMQCHLSGSVTSAPISVGDRLIQPVLIVGDPLTIRPKEDPPPKYSR